MLIPRRVVGACWGACCIATQGACMQGGLEVCNGNRNNSCCINALRLLTCMRGAWPPGGVETVLFSSCLTALPQVRCSALQQHAPQHGSHICPQLRAGVPQADERRAWADAADAPANPCMPEHTRTQGIC